MLLLFFYLLIIYSNNSLAHPLTYKGGSEFYFETQPYMKEFNLLHTIKLNQSIGIKYLKMNKQDAYLTQMNKLLKRYNNEDSQANFYFLTALGLTNHQKSMLSIGMSGDWESRKYYISGKYVTFNRDQLIRSRIGFAPYLASFKETQMWTMLEYNNMASEHSFNDLTPILRMIKGQVLIDLGISIKSNYLLNFMLHF